MIRQCKYDPCSKLATEHSDYCPEHRGIQAVQAVQAEAIRNPIQFRFDILDPEFLEALAKIADYGAKKYGDFNWHKSRLSDDKSPLNHIAKHFVFYHKGQQYDHLELGLEKKWHLVAIAFNAMMEFWYESHEIK